MDIIVSPAGFLAWQGKRYRCALGRGGVTTDKREGDGATPAGSFPLRRVLYRSGRLPRPATGLPVARLTPQDGWCDHPTDPSYNQQVRLPYEARCERLWRDDARYDVIVVLGYNDAPVVPGRGSAIFLHVAPRNYVPTEGCVALARADLLDVLEGCDSSTRLRVESQRRDV